MKILATDFDGTFFIRPEAVPQNIEAVKRWQNAGNQFGIVTGRPYPMILPELERWQIPVDFLICVNGAAVHEPDGTLLWSATIPDKDAQEILSLPELETMPYYLAATQRGLAIRSVEEPHPFWKQVCNLGRVEPEVMRTMTGVLQISTAFDGSEEAHAFAKKLDQLYHGAVSSHVNRCYCDTIAYGSSKAEGLFHLAEEKGWNPDIIYTMGDGCNDLPMLRAFHGAAPVTSEKQVLAEITETYESVAAYIDALMA